MSSAIETVRPVRSTGDSGLTARAIRMAYGPTTVLHDVDIDLRPRTVTALWGSNGSGKTTLARVLSGLVEPAAGEVLFDGHPLDPGNRRWRHVGFLPQGASLDSTLPAADLLYFQARYFGLTRRRARERSDELIHALALDEWAGKVVAQLSGGLQRRVALARVLVSSPQVLILDEPTTGLDAEAVGAMVNLLRVQRDEGVAVAVATHDAHFVESIADGLLHLVAGRATWCPLADLLAGAAATGYAQVTLVDPLTPAGWRALVHARFAVADLSPDGRTFKVLSPDGRVEASAITLPVREFRSLPGSLATALARRTAVPVREEDLRA